LDAVENKDAPDGEGMKESDRLLEIERSKADVAEKARA
jgi:hypothetical protein